MIMDRFINNLRVLWRAERAIADIRLRHALTRSSLNVAAAVLALIGLLMLEVAAFFALREVWSTIASALALGAVNFVIAGILLLIASRSKPGRELELANEIEASAIEALQNDARMLQQEFGFIGRSFKHPFESALPLIVPLATMLINALKKPTSEAKKPKAEAK
jgi:hypothetical protein